VIDQEFKLVGFFVHLVSSHLQNCTIKKHFFDISAEGN